MEAPEHLTVFPQLEAGEVEVRQIVAVADIEEEVGRSPVVPVLEQFDQGKLEEALEERDGSFDVAAEHGEVMQTPCRGSRPVAQGPEVPGLQRLPFRGPVDVASMRGHGVTPIARIVPAWRDASPPPQGSHRSVALILPTSWTIQPVPSGSLKAQNVS